MYLFLIPSFKPRSDAKTTTTTTLLREYDVFGTVLSIGAIVSLIMAINFGGTLYPWGSGQIIGLFVLFLLPVANQPTAHDN